jgi:hypothetical protein
VLPAHVRDALVEALAALLVKDLEEHPELEDRAGAGDRQESA